ncbi:MAG: DUF4258 domain-containing protein [Sphingomonadales bacterium]|nr:DUF4258 domain-containing protein [Sphingomonadales bacterium]NCQ21914.1 DUF4258 domain-containing protein [Sphingomonadales bacterium]NCT04548.1 DUF4258 domain-containing protein [Sphingomonadales bacterium]
MWMIDATALKVLRKIATDSARVVLTDHARLRMRQRKVSVAQVLTCLQRGIISEPVPLDPHGNWKLTVAHRVAG